ncbi:LOW QUALITY PROTEIN: MYG1 exonuclease-like [Amphiura filiformis]|uniref:LOW QUALITY PROTEIN: MYG1 exonuclease-like n=1 Tax=Amphiura filiformis TaxID=82378 RepID=UPI003B20CE70
MADSNGGGGDSKRSRVLKKIGTHSGSFHCDEALACFLLRTLPEYKDAEICRTRDPKMLDTCDIVVDVGGVYDPSKHRYDHHQRSFKETMNSLRPETPWTTKLSSAGLVYLHFGEEIIANALKIDNTDDKVSTLYNKMYENFVEEIDAIDNGVSQTEEKPKYVISSHLSSRVKHLNPAWNQPDADPWEGFQKAMALTGEEFLLRLNFYNDSWWPAREIVETALKQRFEVDSSGEIMVLPQGGCPWKEHLYDLEKTLNVETPIKYVLYSDQSDKWRIQCVSVDSHSFENRLSLPEKWRGVRDAELSEVSGIPGCIFVHATGFIGGNETHEGVLQMARTSLTMGKQ